MNKDDIEKEALELAEQLVIEEARKNLRKFIQYTHHNYDMNWHHKLLCDKLQDFSLKKIKRLMIFAPPRHGKLISDDVPVLTTEGWKTHGDINIGDLVFHPSGKAIKVLAKSPKGYASKRIFFTNNDYIDCHENHEWTIFDRSLKKIVTKETGSIEKINLWSNNRAKYQLPKIAAIQFKEQNLDLHPYVLGAWLGDGTTGAARISYDKKDRVYIEKIISLGYKVSSEYIHKITGVITTNFGGSINRAGRLTRELQTLNIFNKKRIPLAYKQSSITQRLELIAGLIDTDGHTEKETGRVRIVTVSRELADDIFEIVSSLGWYPYITIANPTLSSSGIQGKKCVFTIGFQPDIYIPVALERKKINKFAKRRKIGIKKIENIIPVLGNCIQVDSEDGLYLIGKNFIPTHNSEIISRRLPAYILGINPNASIMSCSYGADLASRMNRDVQRIIDSKEYNQVFPETNLFGQNVRTVAQGSYLRNNDIFEIVGKRGVYKSAGVGGGITGQGFEYGLVDDPIKNQQEADSPTYRQNIWDWYTTTFHTRAEKDACICIILTRWHEDDLAGKLLELAKNDPAADQWEVISLPAIKEGEPTAIDPRKEGEVLWPNKYTKEEILSYKAEGSQAFSAIYQQAPAPPGGNIINRAWWRFYTKDGANGTHKLPDKFDLKIQSWDMAFKDTNASAYVVGQIWGMCGANKYLIDQVRDKMDFVKTLRAVEELSNKHPDVWTKLVEEKANGAAVISMLKDKVGGFIAINPEGSKEARMSAESPQIESGNVFLPAKSIATFDVDGYINECAMFPNGKYKDQVDTTSQALNYFRTKKLKLIGSIEVPEMSKESNYGGFR
jgi:predicted phage terminase large subunit-like protein